MINLFYAVRGLWRMAAKPIRVAVRNSLITAVRMVCDSLSVALFIAVIALTVSGYVLLLIKVIAIMLHAAAQGPIAERIATVMDNLNQTLSAMPYFKIAVLVSCVVTIALVLGSVRFNWTKIPVMWQRLVEAGKDKR